NHKVKWEILKAEKANFKTRYYSDFFIDLFL
ncbi:MAG: hypothetical protein ACI9N1_002227, partial [Flavobacteriales bacterium]